jgi:hypothetical protein
MTSLHLPYFIQNSYIEGFEFLMSFNTKQFLRQTKFLCLLFAAIMVTVNLTVTAVTVNREYSIWRKP